MKNILRKQTWYRHIAIFLSLILLLTGAMPVRAVDYIHSEDNLHYMIYTDMNALYEKMQDALSNNNLAVIGGNILLPHMEEAAITEGIEYLDELNRNLVDKYLVDTVSLTDNLTVYLTANLDTFEFYLLVSNETDEEHEIQLIFADGMEFQDIAMAYSFRLVDLPMEEPLKEKEIEEDEIPGEENPGEGNPGEGNSGEENPGEGNSEEENPAEENPGEENPAEENPGEGNSGEENPEEENPAAETPDAETPDAETPDAETLDTENPGTDLDNEASGDSGEDKSGTENPSKDLSGENQSGETTQISSFGGWNQLRQLGSNVLPLITETENPIMENSGSQEASEQEASVEEETETQGPEDVETPGPEEPETEIPGPEEPEPPKSEEPGSETPILEEPELPVEEVPEDNDKEAIPPSGDIEESAQEPSIGSLEISAFLGAMSLTPNSISLMSSPSTATTTQFAYTSGELFPSIDKTGFRNEDGTYTINLSVRGNNDITIKPRPINLVLALDVSNSMYWAMDDVSLALGFDVSTEPKHYRWNDTSVRSRWSILQDAVSKIVSDVIDESLPEEERSQVSIVLFSGDNHITNSRWDSRNFTILKDWSKDELDINSTYVGKELYQLTAGPSGNFDTNFGKGGTNGEAGYLAAGLQLEKVKDNGNPNHVVYITDGIANRYLVDNTVVGINSDTEAEFQIAANQAIEVAKSIKSNYNASIYTVGVSKALETIRTIRGKTYNGPLLCGYLLNPTTPANKYQEAYYVAGDAQALADALSNITQNVTGNTLKNLVVTDQLSKYVTLDGGLPADSNATIDEDGTITWNVAGGLSYSETKILSYRVRVNNGAAYSDESRLTPVVDYQDNDDNLIGYYTRDGEEGEKKLYFHSNDYAILDYTNIQGEARQMSFRHPVVEPGARPNILTISKQMREGDVYPEDIEFQFNVSIDGSPYEGTLTSSTGKIRQIQGGVLYLNPNETMYISIDIDEEGDTIPYEVTEVQYTQEGIESDLVDVIIQGNGIRSGYTVSGTLGENGIEGDNSTLYYYCREIRKKKYSYKYEYTWMVSSDNMTWQLLEVTEGTSSTEPTLPTVLIDAGVTPTTMFYDSSDNYVANPINLPLDYVLGEGSDGVLKKVKNHSEAIIFNHNSDYSNKDYVYKTSNDTYSYNGKSRDPKWRKLDKVHEELGVGYENVGYLNVEESLGKGKKGRQRHVYFFNPVECKKVYVVQSQTPGTPPTASNTEITFINSYSEIKGSITINKSINDYYSAHGNPTFIYRLDKMKGTVVEETFYDFIEFDITSGGFTKENVTNGAALHSRHGDRADNILFDELPVGTYILTEQQPIRYEYGSVTVDTGYATTNQASKSNKGKVIIVIGSSNKDVEISYVNERFTDSYFSHTDIVRNRVRIVPPPQ